MRGRRGEERGGSQCRHARAGAWSALLSADHKAAGRRQVEDARRESGKADRQPGRQAGMRTEGAHCGVRLLPPAVGHHAAALQAGRRQSRVSALATLGQQTSSIYKSTASSRTKPATCPPARPPATNNTSQIHGSNHGGTPPAPGAHPPTLPCGTPPVPTHPPTHPTLWYTASGDSLYMRRPSTVPKWPSTPRIASSGMERVILARKSCTGGEKER